MMGSQLPETHVRIPVMRGAGAWGAATAYVLRRVAYCAGAYAPGIHEQWFDEVAAARDLDAVQRWFVHRDRVLHELGYRTHARAEATPTAELLAWVTGGRGYRGAIVPRSTGAIAIAVDHLEPGDDQRLVIVDPCAEPERTPVSPALEPEHRALGFQALAVYWAGWS